MLNTPQKTLIQTNCPCPARFSECPPPSFSIGGGRSAGHHHQPDVHDVPPLHEEKIRIPDPASQHPLLSPGANSTERQHYQRPHCRQPDRKIFSIQTGILSFVVVRGF